MLIVASNLDFTTSVTKALAEVDPKWERYPGVIVAGTHEPSLLNEKLAAIKDARESRTPFLGICWGMQLAVIEYARNVLKMPDANSTEVDPSTPDPVVIKMPDLRVGIRKVNGRLESFWHTYQVNPAYLPLLQNDWMLTMDEDGIVAEMRHRQHFFSIGVAFHPEYCSTEKNPHPVLIDFINACKLYRKIL